MRRPQRLLFAVVLIVGLLGSACGSGSTSTESASTPATAESSLAGQFETLDGATIDLGSLAGEDVVLWFWAPW